MKLVRITAVLQTDDEMLTADLHATAIDALAAVAHVAEDEGAVVIESNATPETQEV